MSFVWTDHACRICASRIAEHQEENGIRRFECGTCGAVTKGVVEDICGCGFLEGVLPNNSHGPRYRCTHNEHVSATHPSLIVIAFGEVDK